jgi:hypothetical protein
MDPNSSKLWGVTDAIKTDVASIKVTMARLEERSVARDAQIELIARQVETMGGRVNKLDLKLAAAMGGVTLIAWGFQLLAPVVQ